MLKLITEGGPLMYPLVLCSLISLTLIIERIIFWGRINRNKNKDLLHEIIKQAQKGDINQVKKLSEGSKDYIINIIRKSVNDSNGAPVEKTLEIGAYEEINRMKKYMAALDTIITLAPLIGIAGTVVGIIVSFNILGGSITENPKAITGGIAQALITTAAGLIIAIVTLVPYNYFLTRVDKATQNMESYLTNFQMMYEKNRNK